MRHAGKQFVGRPEVRRIDIAEADVFDFRVRSNGMTLTAIGCSSELRRVVSQFRIPTGELMASNESDLPRDRLGLLVLKTLTLEPKHGRRHPERLCQNTFRFVA